MKSTIIVLLVSMVAAVGLLINCSRRSEPDDSKVISEERNNEKFRSRTSEKDAQFVVDIVSCALAELKIASLGEQQAKNTAVKEIATLLKAQEAEVLSKFKTYASLKQISIPTDLTAQAKEEEIEVRDERDEKDFDSEWCRDVKKMHKDCLEKMERGVTAEITDPELKDLTRESLPEMRLHYAEIIACADRLK